MANAEYEVGDAILLTGTFTDATRALADPTTVAAKVCDAAGVVTSYAYPATITRASVGVYTVTFTAAKAGPHSYEFVGTGTVPRAKSGTFGVKLTPFV